jgi:hypothetical protein
MNKMGSIQSDYPMIVSKGTTIKLHPEAPPKYASVKIKDGDIVSKDFR